MVVVREGEDDAVFLRSGACLEIAAALGGVWQMLFLGRLVPRFLRDGIYRLVARNRRRWRNDSTMCDLPDEAFRERLLP